jgi:hypothetical protein
MSFLSTTTTPTPPQKTHAIHSTYSDRSILPYEDAFPVTENATQVITSGRRTQATTAHRSDQSGATKMASAGLWCISQVRCFVWRWCSSLLLSFFFFVLVLVPLVAVVVVVVVVTVTVTVVTVVEAGHTRIGGRIRRVCVVAAGRWGGVSSTRARVHFILEIK